MQIWKVFYNKIELFIMIKTNHEIIFNCKYLNNDKRYLDLVILKIMICKMFS